MPVVLDDDVFVSGNKADFNTTHEQHTNAHRILGPVEVLRVGGTMHGFDPEDAR